MKVVKQAVQYYTVITGNDWSDFFNKIDDALEAENPSDELWLIKKLLDTIVKNGYQINDIKTNKDAVKALFDEDGRKQAGEFFTPIIWAEEAHKYLTKYIPNWRTEYNVWEMSCYDMDTEIYIRREIKNGNNGIIDCNTDDSYYTGWVKYSDLLDTDLVLALDTNDFSTKWCDFVSRFTRKSNKLYKFVASYSVGGTGFSDSVKSECCVSPEHKMYVLKNGIGISISAENLLEDLKKSFYSKQGVSPDKFELVSYDRDIDNYGLGGNKVIKLGLDYSNCEVLSEEDYDVWDITMSDYHIFLTRHNGNRVFSKNCGSGNLIRTAGITPSNLYASTLQKDDIELIKSTPELEGCNAFQCDFLADLDYDTCNTDFLDKLPPRLKEIIVNDEPLVIFANPPYKSGSSKNTDVGRYMCNIGLGKPAYDIFYQFCWRVMHFVDMFNLSNTYYCFFGPLTFFTGASAGILLDEFEHCFEFIDGMCISAQEFSDTSESILWGIGCSLWKSRGGYVYEGEDGEKLHKDILLDKKYKLPDGGIGCDGKVLYAQPREKLSDWVQPKDVLFYEDAPLMTSHLTFKGSDAMSKEALKSGRIASNALGTLMIGNTLTRSSDQSALLSMPTTIQFTSITEENFWRCVSSYAFRRIIDAGWAIAKKEISAPNESVEGYDLWLKNALVIFLFEWKSMMSSIRGVQWKGSTYNIRNKLFYISEEEFRENCHDERIIADFEANKGGNEFMLAQIEKVRPYWVPEVAQLFDFCKNYTLFSYDKRASVNYKGHIDAWDAGFQQIRAGLWNDTMEANLSKCVAQARDWLRKDIMKFGFVTETEDKDL